MGSAWGDMPGIRIIADDTWREVARGAREALELLGWGEGPRCLPDEAAPCGAGFALHAAASFATIAAICEHQLEHLGPELMDLVTPIHARALETLRGGACQLGADADHGPHGGRCG